MVSQQQTSYYKISVPYTIKTNEWLIVPKTENETWRLQNKLVEKSYSSIIIMRTTPRSHQLEEYWGELQGDQLYLFKSPGDKIALGILKLVVCHIKIDDYEIIKKIGKTVKKNILQFACIQPFANQLTHVSLSSHKQIGKKWLQNINKILAEKAYFFLIGWLDESPKRAMIDFIRNKNAKQLIWSFNMKKLHGMETDLGKKMNCIRHQLDNFFMYTLNLLTLRSELIELDFSGQKLHTELLKQLFQCLFSSNNQSQIRILKLDGNQLDILSLAFLNDFLISKRSFNVRYLSLNYCSLDDYCLSSLGQCLLERHKILRTYYREKSKEYQLPFNYLGLSKVDMTDVGLFNILSAFEKIQYLNSHIFEDYDEYLILNISKNNITENSLISMGNFLRNFNGISYLDMSYSHKIKSLENEYFFDSLIENYSIVELDLSYINISKKTYDCISKMLKNNFVLQNLKISITENIIERMKTVNKDEGYIKYFLINYFEDDRLRDIQFNDLQNHNFESSDEEKY